jgi:diguanylate cyclase (GGDEF)-like protein
MAGVGSRWVRFAFAIALASVTVASLPLTSAHFAEQSALQSIPDPEPTLIRPRVFAAYGAFVGGTLLAVLYLIRGRAFIVYWVVSWMMVGASLSLASRGYRDIMLGSVMLGIAELMRLWSAGLVLLAADAFPDAPLRWTTPVKLAAVAAVWFVAGPLVLPLKVVFVTGPTATGLTLAWAALRYMALFTWTRYAGAAIIGIGMVLLGLSDLGTAALAFEGETGSPLLNRVLVFNIVTNIFVILGMHLLVFEDMTAELRHANRELEAANEQVQRLAITDSLTNCYNRRFFEQIERREMQRHQRYGSPLAVMFVDVNHLKKLNDTLGHAAGDAMLRAIGAMLRRQVRESDYVIRWGGDEFLLILACNLTRARHKAAEIKTVFYTDPDTTAVPDGMDAGVGLSVGVAEVSTDSADLADAIRLADERMYEDKSADRSVAT